MQPRRSAGKPASTWCTFLTFGSPRSSTARSISANWWSTIGPTIWCLRNPAGDQAGGAHPGVFLKEGADLCVSLLSIRIVAGIPEVIGPERFWLQRLDLNR